MKLSRLSNRQLRRLVARGEVRFGPGEIEEEQRKEWKKILARMKKGAAQVNKELLDLSYKYDTLTDYSGTWPAGTNNVFAEYVTLSKDFKKRIKEAREVLFKLAKVLEK